MVLLILMINLGISYWNARVCGQAWVETKVLGGFMRLLVWCGAIQSAIGFSMVFLYGIAALADATGYLPPQGIKLLMSFWYLAIIIPLLGTGIIITVHSWIIAFRERSLLNMASAAWNTYAQISNTYHAIDGIGKAAGTIAEAFSDALKDDSNDAKGKLVIVCFLLALIALMAGALCTALIIRRHAATLPVPQRIPSNQFRKKST